MLCYYFEVSFSLSFEHPLRRTLQGLSFFQLCFTRVTHPALRAPILWRGIRECSVFI